MGMSTTYGPVDDDESIATIHAAPDAGVNLLDTGDVSVAGHIDILIGRALHTRQKDPARLSVPFGASRRPRGGACHVTVLPPRRARTLPCARSRKFA